MNERVRWWPCVIERTPLAGSVALPARGLAALALRVPEFCPESGVGARSVLRQAQLLTSCSVKQEAFADWREQ
jgi:hypothetical protein